MQDTDTEANKPYRVSKSREKIFGESKKRSLRFSFFGEMCFADGLRMDPVSILQNQHIRKPKGALQRRHIFGKRERDAEMTRIMLRMRDLPFRFSVGPYLRHGATKKHSR